LVSKQFVLGTGRVFQFTQYYNDYGDSKMNERIKELAREAGLLAYNPEGPPTKLEKFAELIVQECASKVDFILRERRDGGGTMGDKIREHFGVEE